QASVAGDSVAPAQRAKPSPSPSIGRLSKDTSSSGGVALSESVFQGGRVSGGVRADAASAGAQRHTVSLLRDFAKSARQQEAAGEHAEARRVYQRARMRLKGTPEESVILLLHAKFEYRRGQTAQARTLAESAIRIPKARNTDSVRKFLRTLSSE
ncbi:MAG: hypothetical protein AAFN74_20680, partial [Myxococcota bacterium]